MRELEMARCRRPKRWRQVVVGALLLLVLIMTADVASAQPSVESAYPAAGQRGEAFVLTAVGSGFDESARVLLYDARVQCESVDVVSGNELKITLRSEADCPPGTFAFRVSTKRGISELHVFLLSTFPVCEEAADNDMPETAQSVEGSQTVVGVMESGDADCFRVTLKKGERFSAEVEAIRAGGELLDTVLNVFDPQGTWLLSVDDTSAGRQDPFVSFEAAMDGDYVLQLHEVSFEGSESARYAIHIGRYHRPSFVYPPGGQIGETVELNIPGTGATSETMMLPLTDASLEAGTIDRISPGTGGVILPTDRDSHSAARNPVAIPFRFSNFPNVLEEDHAAGHTDAVRVPAALNGILSEPGEVDQFVVTGNAGQLLEAEVFADRLGSPLDSILTVTDADGRLIARSDDGPSHDSQLTLRFPESANYTVRIEDKRGNGGAGHFYRIEFTEKQPQLTAFLSRPDRRSQERQAIAVPQGNRVLTFPACQRRGFTGAVHLTASGLPSGVQLQQTAIPEDCYWVPVVVEADRDAVLAASLVHLEVSGAGTDVLGRAVDVSGDFRQVVDLVAESADQLFCAAEVNRLAVAVTEPVPFHVELQPPTAPLAPDGTLDLQVTIYREDGFDGPVQVSLPFLPPWVDGPESITIAGDETSAVYRMRALPNAAARDWPICAEAHAVPDTTADGDSRDGRGEASSRRRRVSVISPVKVASSLMTLSIQPSPVSGQLHASALEQGVPATVQCQVSVNGHLPESLTAVLEGLPNRVSSRPLDLGCADIRNGQMELVFDIVPEDSAPVGTFDDLLVRITGEIDGRQVSWCVGRGGRLTIARAGELFRDEAGRPLTRLQALKQSRRANAEE